MYFPYLRGRQFELIALREMLERDLLHQRIIPIIEPVKLSNTLVKTMEIFKTEEHPAAVIVNPKVGSYDAEAENSKNQNMKEAIDRCVDGFDQLLFAYILDDEENELEINRFAEKYKHRMITICSNKDGVPVYEKYFKDEDCRYNLIPDESGYRRKIRKNRVLLADRFIKRERNLDYLNKVDEPFSEDHLYYLEDGYFGFADYSIIGAEYQDTGFAPYAVAIHIVYFDENQSLRVRHFVSETNDDISNPAGKFQEALEKLVKWNQKMGLKTTAIIEFERLYKEEIYPGLGVVKKLSIMHHLELIGDYFNQGKDNK